MSQEEEEKSDSKQATVLPIDWTQLGDQNQPPPLRYPTDVADLDANETELLIVGTSGQKITHMGPDLASQLHPQLTSLILRSHLIAKMEGIEGLPLEVLELYDNQVQELELLPDSLRVLDMSFNVLREMSPVQLCPNLQELYLANNKLKEISGLKGLTKLRKLDLGANRIRVMEGFADLVNLEELWLGKNKIDEIQGLETLTKLRRLDVQSNRLTAVANLQTQVDTLEELYLSHNGIDNEGAAMETGLALTFPNLSVLDLNRNRLTSTDPLVHQPALDELWISGNCIATMDDVQSLTDIKELDTIYLEFNDCQKDPLYRKKLSELMPNLEQIDADPIRPMSFGDRGGVVETTEERARRLQELALQRAQEQSKISGSAF